MEDENSVAGGQVKRLSIDCKATVNIGDYSRGGKTGGDSRAADHDMGCEEKYIPFGIVDFVDHARKIVQLLYYPPYHSKYNPFERCWDILEQRWNGAKRVTAKTMLEWAKSMTWKGIQPVVNLSEMAYQKGISLPKVAMQAIEARLERNPILPKGDILIRPG